MNCICGAEIDSNKRSEHILGHKNVICSLVQEIGHVSDVEYQQRVWVRDESRPQHFGTFDESVSRVFDDSRIEKMTPQEAVLVGLTPPQFEQLKTFAAIFSDFIERIRDGRRGKSDAWIVTQPCWMRVVTGAQETVAALRPWQDANCDADTSYAMRNGIP